MTHAHHDAAADHQRSGGEAELLGSEQRRDHNVPSGLELSVDLNHDPLTQTVEHQSLLGLGKSELPWGARVLERSEWRGTRTTVMARDEHDVGMRLADACGDRSHTDLRHELDVHARRRIGVLEVVDQLRQVFDGVDVVVRWRRDEPDPWSGVPSAGNPRIDLVSGQLTALAWLGALG